MESYVEKILLPIIVFGLTILVWMLVVALPLAFYFRACR